MNNLNNKLLLENQIKNTMLTHNLERYTLIENNTSSIKSRALIIQKKYNNSYNYFMDNLSKFDDNSFSLIKEFSIYSESISNDNPEYYLSCLLLLSDYIDACIDTFKYSY